MKSKTRTIKYRRSREGKTSYKTRLKLLLSKKCRIAVRKSSKYIHAQIIEYDPKGDKVLITTSSKILKDFGWKGNFCNMPAAYLTGLILAKKMGNKNCIFDLGLQTSIKGNVIFAFAKGCLDGGLVFPCSKEVFPSEDKITGKHIADFAKLLKADKERFEKQFGKLSKNIDPEKIVDHFKEVKQKILEK